MALMCHQILRNHGNFSISLVQPEYSHLVSGVDVVILFHVPLISQSQSQ